MHPFQTEGYEPVPATVTITRADGSSVTFDARRVQLSIDTTYRYEEATNIGHIETSEVRLSISGVFDHSKPRLRPFITWNGFGKGMRVTREYREGAREVAYGPRPTNAKSKPTKTNKRKR